MAKCIRAVYVKVASIIYLVIINPSCIFFICFVSLKISKIIMAFFVCRKVKIVLKIDVLKYINEVI